LQAFLRPPSPKGVARQQARFLDAYARTGAYAAGCRNAGISWQHFQVWLLTDELFRYRLSDALDQFLDGLRLVLNTRAREGHTSSITTLFRLARQGNQLSLLDDPDAAR
jgi:hypothetical protein